MKISRRKWVAIAITLVLAVAATSIYLFARQPSERPYDGTIIIFFQSNIDIDKTENSGRIQQIISSVGGTEIYRNTEFGVIAIRPNPLPTNLEQAERLVRLLENESEVSYAHAQSLQSFFDELRRRPNPQAF